jgi:DNA-binding transcriptional LysR family regulator
MDVRALRHAVAIADAQSFTRAAARLGIAQPPLSASIAALERELGVRLFDRGRQRTTPTAEGEAFCTEARAILERVAALPARVRSARAGERLVVGYVAALADRSVPAALARFRARFPDVAIELRDMTEPEQLAALAEQTIDVAFHAARPRKRSRGLSFVPWRKTRLGIVASDDHPLAKRGGLRDLATERCYALAARVSAEGSRRALALYTRAGVPPENIVEVSHVTAMIDLIAAGLGVAVLPDAAVRTEGVTFRALRELPVIELVLAHVRTAPTRVREFVDVAQQRGR